MVRVDTSKDYYADLGVSPDCSTDEVKKHFRKLALQLHPDRHPGHEDEYTARFQSVRAAHDVLSDPEQRAKYDKNRRRGNINSNAFDRPSPPRRNTASYNAPTTPWPPPPSRTNPRRAPQDAPPAASGGGGAFRYTNFAPPQVPTSAKQDARARQTVFQAWRKMNHHQQAQAGGAPRPPSHSPGRFPPAPSPTPDDVRDSRPPSAWAEVNRPPPSPQKGQGGWPGQPPPPPRRHGFDPSNRAGDEGPAARVGAYGSSSRHERPDYPPRRSPDLPPRSNSSAPKRVDSFHDDAPYTEGTRERHPYTSERHDRVPLTGNESLRRSATTKESPRTARPQSYFAPELSGQGYSTERRKSADASAAGFATSTPGLNLPRPATLGAEPGSKTHFIYSDQSEDDSDGAGSTDPQFDKKQRDSRAAAAAVAAAASSEQNSSSQYKVPPSEAWAQTGNLPASNRSMRAGGRDHHSGRHAGIDTDDESARRSSQAARETMSRASNSDLEQGAATSPGNITSDNLQTPDDLPRNHSSPDMAKVASSSTGRNYVPTNPSPLNPDAPLLSPDKEYFEESNTGAVNYNSSFQADEWAKKMREDNWASRAPTSPGRTSPSRAGAVPRKPVRGGNSQPPADIDLERAQEYTAIPTTTEQGDRSNVNDQNQAHVSGGVGSADGDPMDIDTEEQAQPEVRRPSIVISDNDGPSNPRRVFVEPSKPEWQEASSNGERRWAGDIPPNPISRTNIGSRSSARSSSNISMDAFRHVHPFSSGGTSGAGLGDVTDMSDSLPFPSQAAPSHPKRNSGSNDQFPPRPKPPAPPGRLSKVSWSNYLADMTRYFRDWNTFNARVVSIFQDFSRRYVDMEKGRPGKMVDGWLGAVGETEDLGGWDSYVRLFNEEKRLRLFWEQALAQHEATMEAHDQMRQRVLHGQFKR